MTVSVRAREPAVDGETVVQPAALADLSERESMRYRVLSKELGQWLESKVKPPKMPVVRQFECVADCVKSAKSTSCATFEDAFTVYVKELRYPGRPQDAWDATGKWVYIFRQGKLVVEAMCVEGDTWEGWTVQGSSRRAWGSARGVKLDPGPKGQRYSHSYLLSPVRLPQEVIDGIDPAKLELAAVECACNRYDKTVYVPDPFHWACEVNELYYAPRVSTLSAWLFDEGLVAYEFIARVLKAWTDPGVWAPSQSGAEGGTGKSGDLPVGGVSAESAGAGAGGGSGSDGAYRGEARVRVWKTLSRKPDAWLDARAEGIRKAQREADEAAAYLAHCLESVEYLAVEKACLKSGKEELELAAVCLSTAIRGILQTEPGRQLAVRLTQNEERLPARIIFRETPALNAEYFARYRYGQKGLLGITGELLATWSQLWSKALARDLDRSEKELAEIDRTHGMSERIKESLRKRARVQQHLKNVGVKTRLLSELESHLLGNLERDKPITAGAKKGSKQERQLRDLWDQLIGLAETKIPTAEEVKVAKVEERIAKTEEKAAALAARFEPYERFSKKLNFTAVSVVEVANLVVAVQQLMEAKDSRDARGKAWAAFGALLDLVQHGTGLALATGLAETVVKSTLWVVGGAAGAVSGVIDMLGYREGFLEACEEYDYGKAVGRGFQVAGAAASTTGGAMLVAYALEASKLGTAGVVIGALGGLLVAGGYALVHWLQLNINETFANRSFLGNCRNETPRKVSWSRTLLPTQKPGAEAGALVDLLAQFSLATKTDRNGVGCLELEILPGYVGAQSVFEIDIENRWDSDAVLARIIAAAPLPADPGIAPELGIPLPERYRLIVDPDQNEIVQVMGPPLKPGRFQRDARGDLVRIVISTEELQGPDSTLKDVGALTLDEIAGVLAGPPGCTPFPQNLRSRAYQSAAVNVRLLHPDETTKDARAQHVPAKEGMAVQLLVPNTPPVFSLDQSTWTPMPQLAEGAK